ncbi:uncharacterized protein N7477_002881 [Penicillium maclennaniae]|uniref:uncharacterized protein n=1 Tax=Penicillium maclennaniae TaxID=1343394 RepID=UPI0025415072|nr:uncharacterized protein N7477_002881 [Penicillium maclennaniae]KAJ5677248.1 hypothetical protein N7477_002881 [Penicillium maclennaniae]
MTAQNEPEIVLFDLACTKNVCFSPVAWRIRLMLNYKCIPYQTKSIEFTDIQPTLQSLNVHPAEASPGTDIRYTVPVILRNSSNKYIFESALIAEFLESTYPDQPVPLMSSLGNEIETKARRIVGAVLRSAVMPREIHILSPRAQEYFRRTREASLGHSLEDLLVHEAEYWDQASDSMRAVAELMQTKKADGPSVLGAKPSYTDFIAGSLQAARVVDEGVFQKIMEFPGYKEIYQACLRYMEKKD